MLLVSTRLVLLACNYLSEGYYQGKRIPAPELAAKYNINVRAIMPALRNLTRAGILSSQVGGREPGFIFTRDPKEISYYDIVSTLEGVPQFHCCKQIDKSLKCDCDDVDKCELYRVFNLLSINTINILSQTPILSPANISNP